MSAPVDYAAIVRDFQARLGPNADQLPLDQLSDPFDYAYVRDGKMKTNLPAGLRGELATLHATEKEINNRYAKERAHTTQDWVSRRLASLSGHDSAIRDLDVKAQNELSQAREHWFRDLPEKEKAAFDAFCLAIVENVLSPILPAGLPGCLQGPIARLALEGAHVLKTYNAKRSALQERHRSQGANWTVTQSFVDGLFRDQQDAQAQLEGRWLRELTQEQQDAIDGRSKPARNAKKRRPKPRRNGPPGAHNDPFLELRQFAADKLKGIERRIVELVCEHNGTCPLADLAIDTAIKWERPYDSAFNSRRIAINRKLKTANLPWNIKREANTAKANHLVRK